MFKAAASLLSKVRQSFSVRRGVSEYAKKYGYTPEEMYPEVKIVWPEVIGYLTLSGLLIWNMVKDQRNHLSVLMENFDENKKYFQYNLPMSSSEMPNMDFLMEDHYSLYPATGNEGADERIKDFVVDPEHGRDILVAAPDKIFSRQKIPPP
ncbi:uncharacterized protein LOC144746968 [Ciona intestinalis]